MKAMPLPLAAGCLALLLASCPARAQSPSPAPADNSPAPATPAPADNSAAPADNSSAPAAAPEQSPPDLSQYKTADDLWAQIQKWEKGPGSPSASPQEVMDLLHDLTAGAAEFQTRYPKDPRRWEAKLVALQYGSMLDSYDNKQPDPAKIEGALKEVGYAPDAPKEAREEARINLIGMHASGQDTLTPDVDKEMLAFIHDFPDVPDDAQLQKARLESLQKTDAAKAGKLLDALLTDSNPAVADMAKGEVQMRDLMKKPLDLQFTAEDGSKVDLAKLRGKVVLIDFWATWCSPCMEEVPDVVKVYKELHDKGFSIVGISLDEDKSVLEAVTKAQGMVWPQYYDGKGWQNAISSRYGIGEIPTMWLVDKKGMVVDVDARDGLEDKVQKLLAE